MTAPKMTLPPDSYLEIEHALRLIEGGIADALVARRLEGLDHAGAERAAALLRVGKWHQAANELEAALEELAGAPDGSALGWFKPVTEQVRDERRRLW
jgi:hypothetical protein